MLISETILDTLVREALVTESPNGKIITRSGYEVDWGSRRHVDDLMSSLDELIRFRNAQARGSKSRYVYARAVEEMRRQYKSARNYGIKNGLTKDDQ